MSEQSELIREIVAGARHWRDLRNCGVLVDVSPDGVRVLGGQEAPVKIGVEDLARGWLAHSESGSALREWARFVHGAVSLIELDVESHPLGEELLDAVWRASFGEPLSEDMTKTARRILLRA